MNAVLIKSSLSVERAQNAQINDFFERLLGFCKESLFINPF